MSTEIFLHESSGLLTPCYPCFGIDPYTQDESDYLKKLADVHIDFHKSSRRKASGYQFEEIYTLRGENPYQIRFVEWRIRDSIYFNPRRLKRVSELLEDKLGRKDLIAIMHESGGMEKK